jgi:hypothetical protein
MSFAIYLGRIQLQLEYEGQLREARSCDTHTNWALVFAPWGALPRLQPITHNLGGYPQLPTERIIIHGAGLL